MKQKNKVFPATWKKLPNLALGEIWMYPTGFRNVDLTQQLWVTDSVQHIT